MRYVALFLFAFLGGYSFGNMVEYVDKIDHCVSYKTSYSTWVGYKAISESNERRCFWLENKYPYRIKQGVERL